MLDWVQSTNVAWGEHGDFALGFGTAEAGNVNILEWILSNRPHDGFRQERQMEEISRVAGFYGHVSVLQWL